MTCIHCSGENVIKKGKRKSVRQFYCKSCKRHFLEKYTIARMDKKKEAFLLRLHCEGTGTRSIARIMEISHTCVMKTKCRLAKGLPEPKLEPGRIYQVDELATFIAWKKKPKLKKGQKRRKQECWVIHAIDARTGRPVGLLCGKRTKANLEKLIGQLLASAAKKIYTDGLPLYRSLIPDKLHTVFARCTNKIERFNLTLRTHLKRLSRKTLCFSRSKVMLEVDLKLYLFAFRG